MKTDDIESQHVDCEGGASSNQCLMLANNIREMLKAVGHPLSSKCCIYRVHDNLRKLNEAAYTPKLVSIGPFHYGKKVGLKTMEKYKVLYLEKILGRHGASSLEELLNYIKEQEERVRECYAESIELSSDEFVKMILLDASFILEILSQSCVEILVEDEIYNVFSKPWVINCILEDLTLLENQLPFFVLEGLYNLVFPSNRYNNRPSFFLLANSFFNYYRNQGISTRVQVKHFTDLLRTFLQPSCPRLPPKKGKINRYSYTAVELHQAGVKFKVSSSRCLFDIKFSNGVLQIPNFKMEDSTESFLRNLVALEQCHYKNNNYICDYIILMDTLIDTAKDVELLVQNGIISNYLGGNDAVATLINNLGIGIIHDDNESYFYRLFEDLTRYYKNPRHSWKATLTRDYLSTPWRIASTVAAILLLVLTFLQTVNSFISM